MPEVQKQAARAVGWAVSEVLDYANEAPRRRLEAEYKARIEELRSALESGDVDAIIDRFNANHDAAVRVSNPNSPTG